MPATASSMPQHIKQLISALVVMAVLCSSGIHLAVMQGVAYSGMLLEFSKESSFTESVKRTVSGQEPCKLCCAIQKMSTEDQHDAGKEGPVESMRVLGFLAKQPRMYFFPRVLRVVPDDTEAGPQRFLEPPLRPS